VGAGILGSLAPLGNVALQHTGLRVSAAKVTGLFPTILPSPASSLASPAGSTAASSLARGTRADAGRSLVAKQSATGQRAALISLAVAVAALAAWLSVGRARRPGGGRRAR
jgi:hypothetical protein